MNFLFLIINIIMVIRSQKKCVSPVHVNEKKVISSDEVETNSSSAQRHQHHLCQKARKCAQLCTMFNPLLVFRKYYGGEIHLWSFSVGVEFLHQIHALFGVDGPVDDAVSQPDSPQVNGYNSQHAGPLGHDHATGYRSRDARLYYGTGDEF